MAEPNQNPPSSSNSSSFSAPQINRGSTSEASSSSSFTTMSQFREEEEDTRHRQEEFREDVVEEQHYQVEQRQQQNGVVFFRGNIFHVDEASVIRDDTWSCVAVVLTFWFFVSMTLILGVYGPETLLLGPNSSILLETSPMFVQSIKVQELDDSDSNTGLMLYEFYKSPLLDVVKTWSRNYSVSVPVDTHKEWTYFLNEGSELNISYSVNSQGSSIFLIIAQGNEELSQWLQDPTYPNTTLSWNLVHGNGTMSQTIFESAMYYVAVGNLNSEDIEVELNVRVKSLMFNTTEAYYKCDFTDGECSLRILFPSGNSVVLTSSDLDQSSSSKEWYLKVTYGPRWAIYIVGIAGMTIFMLVAFNFLNKSRWDREEETRFMEADQTERGLLLLHKDDDTSSSGSSYDSLSSNEEDLNHEFLLEGKAIRDEDDGNSTRRLCAICFDAPRDCFFLPCGHCVACFACGTRIAEAAGTCPICRRSMRKVRKIFTV